MGVGFAYGFAAAASADPTAIVSNAAITNAIPNAPVKRLIADTPFYDQVLPNTTVRRDVRDVCSRDYITGSVPHREVHISATRPDGSGTRLSESYEVLTPSPRWMNWVVGKLMGIDDREEDLLHGMRTTLERLRRAAERSA